MVERGRGIIVNNASSTGRFPLPLLTLYSASKAYMDFFSRLKFYLTYNSLKLKLTIPVRNKVYRIEFI